MTVTVSRIYDAPGKAAGAVTDLKNSNFSESDITAISSEGKEPASITASITEAGVSSAHAAVYAEAVGRGNSLVIVRPLFGWASKAEAILDSHGPVAVELPVEQPAATRPSFGFTGFSSKASAGPTSTSWSGPAPLSARLGWRVLSDDPTPLSRKFGWRVLLDDPTPLSTKLGWRTVSDNPAPLSSKVGRPVLSDNPAPLSSKLNWSLLSDNPAPFSSKFNFKTLSDKAAPLSEWLNWPVLKKGGATTFDIKLSDPTPTTVKAAPAPTVAPAPPVPPPRPPVESHPTSE